jgi:hypothetical protein
VNGNRHLANDWKCVDHTISSAFFCWGQKQFSTAQYPSKLSQKELGRLTLFPARALAFKTFWSHLAFAWELRFFTKVVMEQKTTHHRVNKPKQLPSIRKRIRILSSKSNDDVLMNQASYLRNFRTFLKADLLTFTVYSWWWMKLDVRYVVFSTCLLW